MSQLNIQEQKKKVTFYKVDNKEFRSQKDAELYVQASQDAVNRVYYDVIYHLSHAYIPAQYTSRCLIGVPKADYDKNPYTGIAWIPSILRYRTEHIDDERSEDWKIVQRHEVQSIEELLSIAKYDGFDIKDYHMSPGDVTNIFLADRGSHHTLLLLPEEIVRE